MARRASLKVDSGDLRDTNRVIDAVVGRVQSLNQATGRLGSQKGGVKAGGGRGVFAGTLRDFGTRDEFVGRAGTIGRGLKAGRIGGALLAFVSVEEAFRGIADFLKGDKNFGEILKDTFQRLLPSVLRESLPAILDEFGLFGASRAERLSIKNQFERQLQGVKDLNDFGEDNEINRRFFRWQAQRFRDSDEYRRTLDESAAWLR